MKTKKIPGGTVIQDNDFTSYESDEYATTGQGMMCFRSADPKVFDKIESIKDFEYEFELFHLRLEIHHSANNRLV